MIQIIGFLICACLAVKLLEIGANPTYKTEGDRLLPGISFTLLFGWAAVAVFAFWLLAQGEAFPEPMRPANADYSATELTDEQIDCINNAKPGDDILAC
jgi:hypothetical protein